MTKDNELNAFLQPVIRCLADLKSTPSCRNLGELQVALSNNIDFLGDFLAPLYEHVTQIFVSSRIDYVNSLSEEDFLVLARKLAPDLFEARLQRECNDDGVPQYDGPVNAPVITEETVSSFARSAFVSQVGLPLVDFTSISNVAVMEIEEIFLQIKRDRGEEMIDAWKSRAAENFRQSAPMIKIPRF